MNYGNIKYCDIANGIGIRTVLFVSGCRHHCKGCFQPETWNFSFGKNFTEEVEKEIIKSLDKDYIDGLTILGGEPFEPENQKSLLPFLKKVKKAFPNKTIWAFSGYTYEELRGFKESISHCIYTDEMLSLIDVLVDGEFQEDLKNLSLQFRGSSNQRLIDMKQTLKSNKIILWQEK